MKYKIAVPPIAWLFFSISCIPIGVGIMVLLFETSELNFTNSKQSFSVTKNQQIQEVTNDSEYANKILLEKLDRLNVRIDTLVSKEKKASPELVLIKEDIANLEPVVKEINKNNEELKQIVETNDL